MRMRGVDLRAGVGRGVVFHLGALRSSVRKVETMDIAVKVRVGVRVCVVFIGCWGSVGVPRMDLTVGAGSMGLQGSGVRFINAISMLAHALGKHCRRRNGGCRADRAWSFLRAVPFVRLVIIPFPFAFSFLAFVLSFLALSLVGVIGVSSPRAGFLGHVGELVQQVL